jgi:beta-galactosidase
MLRYLFAILVGLMITSRAVAEPVVSVAGDWSFALDPSDAGVNEKWFAAHTFADTIALPGTTDLAGKGPLTTGSAPGHLTRVHQYYGPAWYQRPIDVPPAWAGRHVQLELERVIWESRAWVDGKPAGVAESLDTPHFHDLGVLAPGRHVLTLRIDNREIHPVGTDGHNFTEQTQSIWNGAIGAIQLRAAPDARLVRVRAFPDAAAKQVRVEVTVDNAGPAIALPLALTLTDDVTRDTAATDTSNAYLAPGAGALNVTLPLATSPSLWDEFAPNLYTLSVALGDDVQTVPVGFRTLSRAGQHLAVNGRTTFIRGNMDHSICPLTGFPPMDVAGWRRIFEVYKQYGFNQMRCHSWTPPDAAFTAADQMGIYIQSEIFWLQYPLGSGKPVGKLTKVEPGMPPSFASSDQSPDDYVHAELRRIEDAYGNHPSMVFVVIGNELGKSDWPVTGRWIADEKAYDPRHWYAASTARQITPADDFNDTHAVPKVGWVRDRVEAFNDWDYDALYAKAPVPIIAHELGQWPTYPRWSEFDAFTGVLVPRDFQAMHASAVALGTAEQDEPFHNASGALAVRLYKDEMESHLRTANCAGFSTLDMQDYPGQGEAMVGWLDSFYRSKGTVTPARFRQWCAPTVALARLPKYVFNAGEPITGSAEVAHYGPADLHGATSAWQLLADGGGVLAEGTFAPRDVPTGAVTPLGTFTVPPGVVHAPAHVRLTVSLAAGSTTATNDWDLWVMSDAGPATTAPADVVVTESADAARAGLAAGRRVLLMASKLGTKRNANLARFKPVYWSAWYFPGSETLGAIVHNDHPALAQFPTADHTDWEWADLCKTGRGFVVDALPEDLRPIVQPVPDFHLNHRYATIFEASTASGGKLLVCGYDITTKLDTRPAARQLATSLLAYVRSPAFAPTTVIDPGLLDGVLSAPPLASPSR